jgi:hypothetical protein
MDHRSSAISSWVASSTACGWSAWIICVLPGTTTYEDREESDIRFFRFVTRQWSVVPAHTRCSGRSVRLNSARARQHALTAFLSIDGKRGILPEKSVIGKLLHQGSRSGKLPKSPFPGDCYGPPRAYGLAATNGHAHPEGVQGQGCVIPDNEAGKGSSYRASACVSTGAPPVSKPA